LGDICLAGGSLFVLSPWIVVIAVAIRRTMGKPVLFRQMRPGLHGKSFVLYKFRTMNEARTVDGVLLHDKDRLTKFGLFLRRRSLDELPQLFNVLKGDMSMVGPRPLLIEYLRRYTNGQHHRHDVKPGITGWAQINGRQNLKLSERILLDVWYSEHVSFILDFHILIRSFHVILSGAGVQPGQGPRTLDDLMSADK